MGQFNSILAIFPSFIVFSAKLKHTLFFVCFCGTHLGGRAYFCRNKHIFSKKGLETAEICIFSTFLYGTSYLLEKCFFLQKCWICWIMLEILFEKCASFCRNVEYVEYVECFWNLQAMELVSPRYIQHIQHFCSFELILYKKMLLSAEMLNMLNHVGDLVWKMCFFLQKCWICWICWMFLEPTSNGACKSQIHSTYSTYSTFLQKKHFLYKISSKLQKCWICWIMLEILFEKCASFCRNVEYVEYVECFWTYKQRSL